jgi:hypothetical protein
MRFIPLLLLGLTLSACDTATTPPADPLWQTTLLAQPGFEGVTGNATASVATGQTTSTATIANAPQGGVHPWHVHAGTCGSGGPIVGEANAYPPLQVDAGGNATATATIGVALQSNQPYYVNVHLSADELDTIVACGNLILQ